MLLSTSGSASSPEIKITTRTSALHSTDFCSRKRWRVADIFTAWIWLQNELLMLTSDSFCHEATVYNNCVKKWHIASRLLDMFTRLTAFTTDSLPILNDRGWNKHFHIVFLVKNILVVFTSKYIIGRNLAVISVWFPDIWRVFPDHQINLGVTGFKTIPEAPTSQYVWLPNLWSLVPLSTI